MQGMASSSERIVIVEDDLFVLDLLGMCLQQNGYTVSQAKSGAEMFEALEHQEAGLILLDLTLPDEDGLVLTRQIRARSNVPIIVLTSRDAREDRLAALELGADDFLLKPCDTSELLLRVRNLIARYGESNQSNATANHSNIQEFSGFKLDLSGEILIGLEGQPIPLTRSEFNLLRSLINAPNRVLTRDFLLDAISTGGDEVSDRLIDVLISRLRKKLGDNPRSPQIIHTVAGRGYRFTVSI